MHSVLIHILNLTGTYIYISLIEEILYINVFIFKKNKKIKNKKIKIIIKKEWIKWIKFKFKYKNLMIYHKDSHKVSKYKN